MNGIYEHCMAAADHIRKKIDADGAIGIILGSGLKKLSEEITDPIIINYQDIPYFPVSTLNPNESMFIYGHLEGKKVLCIKCTTQLDNN